MEIWQPRYKDRMVLIAKYKVQSGYNEITFTRAKHLAGMKFRVHSTDIVRCPLETNGKIDCYAVPFDSLERIV